MMLNKMIVHASNGQSSPDSWVGKQMRNGTRLSELVITDDDGRKMTDAEIAKLVGQVVGQKVADAVRGLQAV